MGNVYYMDKETFVLKSKQQILVYNYMIEDLKNILPIVQKFDQKFLTKRLTTAMEKVLKHCIVSLHADKIKIKNNKFNNKKNLEEDAKNNKFESPVSPQIRPDGTLTALPEEDQCFFTNFSKLSHEEFKKQLKIPFDKIKKTPTNPQSAFLL